MRISDWSSDVCSSDLIQLKRLAERLERQEMRLEVSDTALAELARAGFDPVFGARPLKRAIQQQIENPVARLILEGKFGPRDVVPVDWQDDEFVFRSEEHTSELQSLMRISYAVFCLKKKIIVKTKIYIE